MAVVWIDREEAEHGDLPPLCLRCGNDATTFRRRQFSWYPGWVNIFIIVALLVWLILALILTKKMRVTVPMCDRHVGHWFRFNLFLYGGLIGMLALLIAGAALSASQDPNFKEIAPAVMIAAGVGFLVVIIAGAIWQLNTIRPVEITDDDIKLTGVSEEFRSALREQRRTERNDRDRDRDRPLGQKYEDDDN